MLMHRDGRCSHDAHSPETNIGFHRSPVRMPGVGEPDPASYLVVKVPKIRIENQIITHHFVNVVLAKTTRNNPVQSSGMIDQAGRTAPFPNSTHRQPDRADTDEANEKERNRGPNGVSYIGPVYLIELMFYSNYKLILQYVKYFLRCTRKFMSDF